MSKIIKTLVYIGLITLIVISFYYEYLAYTKLLDKLVVSDADWIWAVTVALSFSIGKIIIFKSIIDSKSKHFLYLWKSYVTVALLVVNSFICTFAVVSLSLESTVVDKVAQEQRIDHNKNYKSKEHLILKKYGTERTNLSAEFEQKRLALVADFQADINKYHAAIKEERQVKSSFAGYFKKTSIYNIVERLEDAIQRKEQALNDMHKWQINKINELNDMQNAELMWLSEKFLKGYSDMVSSSEAETVKGLVLESLVDLVQRAFNQINADKKPYRIAIIMTLSLVIAILIELLIYAALKYILIRNKKDEIACANQGAVSNEVNETA